MKKMKGMKEMKEMKERISVNYKNTNISIINGETVNKETGEIIQTGEALNIMKKERENIQAAAKHIKKINDIKEKHETHFIGWNTRPENGAHFVKIYQTKEATEAMKTLTATGAGLLMKLTQFIEYETNKIITSSNKTPTNEELEKITGLKSTTLKKYMKELKNKGIIKTTGRGKARALYLNPAIAFKGKDLSRETLNLFQNIEK